MRTKPVLLGVLVGLSFLALGQVPTGNPDKEVDLKVENVDLRDGLRAIFKQAGVSYTIDPEVKGTIRADFRGLVLDDALRVVLRQVQARAQMEAGIYRIVPDRVRIVSDPSVVSLALPGSSAPASDATAVVSDAKSLYVVRFGVVHKIDKATMRETGRLSLE